MLILKPSYSLNNGICYLIIADRNYPKKLSYSLIGDIKENFEMELKNTFGTLSLEDYRTKIESIDTPYYFMNHRHCKELKLKLVDKVLKKKKDEYKDLRNKTTMEKLNSELTDVTSILTEDLRLLMDREQNLTSKFMNKS